MISPVHLINLNAELINGNNLYICLTMCNKARRQVIIWRSLLHKFLPPGLLTYGPDTKCKQDMESTERKYYWVLSFHLFSCLLDCLRISLSHTSQLLLCCWSIKCLISQIWSTDNEVSHWGPTLQSEVNYCSCLWCSSSFQVLQEGELPEKKGLSEDCWHLQNLHNELSAFVTGHWPRLTSC